MPGWKTKERYWRSTIAKRRWKDVPRWSNRQRISSSKRDSKLVRRIVPSKRNHRSSGTRVVLPFIFCVQHLAWIGANVSGSFMLAMMSQMKTQWGYEFSWQSIDRRIEKRRKSGLWTTSYYYVLSYIIKYSLIFSLISILDSMYILI